MFLSDVTALLPSSHDPISRVELFAMPSPGYRRGERRCHGQPAVGADKAVRDQTVSFHAHAQIEKAKPNFQTTTIVGSPVGALRYRGHPTVAGNEIDRGIDPSNRHDATHFGADPEIRAAIPLAGAGGVDADVQDGL